MTDKDINISGSRWLHRDKSNKDLAFMTLAIGLVSLIVIIILRPNAETVLETLFLVAFFTLAVFLTQSKTTDIEIDREKAEVIKITNYRMFTTRKKYPLEDFSLVRLLTVDEPVEDGYRTIRYSVALSGAGRSLELLSADTEGEGKAIQKELAEFLGLPTQGESNRLSKK